jgi:hypothetical protein
MSISTTFRMVKTLVLMDSQAINQTANQRCLLQPITWAGAPQHTQSLDAVLVLVNWDIVGPNDPMVASLLTTLCLQGGSCSDWIDEKTTMHVVSRAYAQDSRIGRAFGQQMFRRLLGEQFDQARIMSTTFDDGCGARVIIIVQWRRESQMTAITAHQRELNHGIEPPKPTRSSSDSGKTASMSHWSWWADQLLSAESRNSLR